jgi:asparagine synthase (glutamine-hydrolysing)
MCGILGGLALEPWDVVAEAGRLARAVDTLAHRGPDDRGELVTADGRGFLGHRRLSIIDLAGGHQPLTEETGRVHLCYNGEIYNYRALRAELQKRGHVLRTATDGETAVHLYQEDPDTFAARLSGMFAIAVLDEAKGELTLARDRHGIKPLYYYQGTDRVIFASELKAILALLPRRPALSAAALQHYLRWKYIPGSLTVYEDIFEVPPGWVLHVRPQRVPGRLQYELERYWLVGFPDDPGERITEEAEALAQLDACVRAAVESHLEADVEVGTLLSGGVDSSLVTALAAEISGKRIKTFCVGFREPGFDQLPYARQLAERYGTEHHEVYVDVDPLAAMPKLVRHFDQPFGDSSALACYYVCEVAARHVKVALTGDGGDETFAGYRRYYDAEVARALDGPVRRGLARAAYAAGGVLFSPEAKFLHRVRAAGYTPLAGYMQRERMCTEWLIGRLLGARYREPNATDVVSLYGRTARAGWPMADQVQWLDLQTYLPGDILPKVDRTSMAWSLECRPPLLDHAVTELALRLDTRLRGGSGEGKYILKRLAERYVPAELIYRKKRGFRVPIRRWFKRELLEHTARRLTDGVLVQQGILDPDGVRWVLRVQRRAWMNLSSCLWALLFMEEWARAYLDD